MTALSEAFRVERPVDRVGRKHPAEQHHLGDQEDPDPERRRLALLFEVVELLIKGTVGLRRHPTILAPCDCRGTGTGGSGRLASSRSCAAAAEMRSATPARAPPTGSGLPPCPSVATRAGR